MITFSDAYVKLKYRLNKSGTADYSSIDKDPATEAINKAQNDLIRRLLGGRSQNREGAEETRLRVDDLQVLLKNRKLSIIDGDIYSDSNKLPREYRYFARLDVYITNACNERLLLSSDLREEANAGVLLTNDNTKPSLQFEQCFHTLLDNKVRLYHNGEFDPSEVNLIYYKSPKDYNANNPDELFEFKDDVVELIIDEAAKIIAGDVSDYNNSQRSSNSVEQNN